MSEAEQPEAKPDTIQLKMIPPDDSQAIDIKATKRTKVGKLITAYAQSKGVAESSLRLFLGSTRLNVESTLGEVQELLRENDNEISVQIAQIGGR